MKEILNITPPPYEYHINLLEDEIATCDTVEKFSALLSKQPIKITQNHVLDSEFEFYNNGVAAAYGAGSIHNISSLAPIFSFRGPKLKKCTAILYYPGSKRMNDTGLVASDGTTSWVLFGLNDHHNSGGGGTGPDVFMIDNFNRNLYEFSINATQAYTFNVDITDADLSHCFSDAKEYEYFYFSVQKVNSYATQHCFLKKLYISF